MWGLSVAVAGAVAAGGCCVAPARLRARILAVAMALACLPLLSETLRMAAAAVVLLLALLLSVGLRHRPAGERAFDMHRALGGALMAGMLFAGGHEQVVAQGAHGHGATASPHVALGLLACGYVAWTLVALCVRRHRPPRIAARVEMAAMAAMFTLAGAAMLAG